MASRSKVSDTHLSTVFTRAQLTMSDENSGRFRRIWVQCSRDGKERVDVVITLFPLVGTYRMVFFKGLNVDTISVESIVGLIND